MEFKPKKILCAVDLSEPSAQVLGWASLFARKFDAQVEVLHVDWWEAPRYFTEAQIRALAAEAEANRARIREQARELAAGALGNVKHEVVVQDGDPAGVILERARRWPADLVVAGSHGRTGLARLRLGSVAESVVSQSSCPVLVVKGAEKPGKVPTIRRVLCPVGFTEAARQCLVVSSEIAAGFGARLHVLHAVEDAAGDLQRAKEHLCEWVPGQVRSRCELAEVVRKGNAAEQIVLHAREEAADLIVIGADRRPFLEVTTLGTTTERVVRYGPRTVLVVPREKPKAKEEGAG